MTKNFDRLLKTCVNQIRLNEQDNNAAANLLKALTEHPDFSNTTSPLYKGVTDLLNKHKPPQQNQQQKPPQGQQTQSPQQQGQNQNQNQQQKPGTQPNQQINK
jgi:hypothetical protein